MVKKIRFGLGTIIKITIDQADGVEARNIADSAFNEINRIEKLMSIHDPLSEISVLNRQGFYENASIDLKNVLNRARFYHKLTDGYFDVTIAPILKARERLSKSKKKQPDSELEDTSELIGSDGINLENGSVRFQKKGMCISLGGIAKGYAVDMAAEKLREKGVKRAIIDAGGDIRVIGGKSDTEPWRIGIRDPEKRKIESIIEIANYSVATSGTYHRRINDIIDPHNARPAQGIYRTTVVAENAMDADALSTAIYSAGKDRGLELIERIKGVEALILMRDGERVKTSGWSEIKL